MSKYDEISDLINQCLKMGNQKYGYNTQMNDNFRGDLESLERAYSKNLTKWKTELLNVLEETV
jgi:hypothetical protein